jgi:hypothetical protein
MLAMSKSSSRRRLFALRIPSAAVRGALIVDVVACGVEAREVDILLGAASFVGTTHGKVEPMGVDMAGESMLMSSLMVVLELR